MLTFPHVQDGAQFRQHFERGVEERAPGEQLQVQSWSAKEHPRLFWTEEHIQPIHLFIHVV